MIMDMVPQLARLYFTRRFGEMSLSPLQETILIGQGLQHKTIDELMKEFPKVESNQVLAFFNRSIRKMQKYLEEVMNQENESSERANQRFEDMMTAKMKPVNESLNDVGKGMILIEFLFLRIVMGKNEKRELVERINLYCIYLFIYLLTN